MWTGAEQTVGKTKEMVVDFKRRGHTHPPLFLGGAAVEMVCILKYLGLHISNAFTWATNTAATNACISVGSLKRASFSPAVLTSFCVVESILTSDITVWYGNCSVADRKALQRVVKSAQKIINSRLPSLDDIYVRSCRSRASSNISGGLSGPSGTERG